MQPDRASAAQETSPTRCGYVTLLGVPNAGKSTLLNALVGQPLSIVTRKPQTTWTRVTGLRTEGNRQFIFLDTPGLLAPRNLLERALLGAAREAAEEADVLVLVFDPVHPLGDEQRERILEVIGESQAPRIAAITKVDVAGATDVERAREWLHEAAACTSIAVSAPSGVGLDILLDEVGRMLPEGPFLFPEDDVASDPVRFFVSEIVRGTIFEQFREEVPYASYCRVEEFRDQPDRTYIAVSIHVERPSQKGILVGKGGRAIRTLGTEARQRIEAFLDRPVYLDLWVKVLPGWRRQKHRLESLGFRVPEEPGETAR